ncbi:MAG: chalcone isomerase family protein [Syntrophobacteraceae bacterium]
MIWRKVGTLLFVVCLFSGQAFAAKVEGAKFPDEVKIADHELVLNGAGRRTFFGIGAYVAGLYLEQKSSDAAKIVDADEPMDIRLVVTSFMVSRNMMKDGFLVDFKKNGTDTAPIKSKIDEFVASFDGLKDHDIYDFAYVPNEGVEVLRNGKTLSVVRGIEFKKALYAIWLGQEPVQKELKEGMLGK